MKQYFFLAFCLLIILIPLSARDFMGMGDALKEIMASEDSLYKEDIVLTKDQAKELNRRYDSDYKKNETLTVYYTKNGQGAVTSYAIVLTDILWKYVASHEWALAFNPDGSIRGIRILSLTDEFTFDMPDLRFLSQFDGLLPDDIRMPGNVDAVTGATMSSELLVRSTKKAWEIIGLIRSRQ